jgi:transcriptional regulator with XRE-family HTH domain
VSIGEGLARARREAGLSLAQVSQRTRIRERIIADIENDDYRACGGDFYARGHIRSIARAIGTDPDPFIREYDAAQPEPDDLAEAEITQPGLAIGIQPGIPLHTEPEPSSGSPPGMRLGTEPGPPGPGEPGWSGSNEPDRPAPAEPSWPTPPEPGWSEPAEPDRPAPAEPGGSEAAEPDRHTPAEPDWRTAAEPPWSEPAEPPWSDPAEPGRTARFEPDQTARTEQGRTTRTDSGFPFFTEPAAAAGARSAPPDGPRLPTPPAPLEEPRRHPLPPPPVPPGRTRRRHPLNWAALVALALLAGIGYLAYHIFAGSSRATSSAHSAPARPPASQSAVRSSPPPAPASTSTPSPSPKPTPRTRPLAPAGAQPLGFNGPGDDPASAHLAIDGNPGTAWHTDWYTSAAFGNLYPGTGLLVNMGRPVTITSAQIRFGPARGGSFQLRVGGRPSLAGLRPVAHGIPAGVTRLRLASPARGRYVLIWFTRLPVDPTGSYRASVYDLRLQGR